MLEELANHGVGGILGIPVNDTVKRVNSQHEITETVSRQGLWRAATPQMFRLQILKDALHRAKQQQLTVTDEASAIEMSGLRPKLIEGRHDNIKLTWPEDLAIAKAILQQRSG